MKKKTVIVVSLFSKITKAQLKISRFYDNHYPLEICRVSCRLIIKWKFTTAKDRNNEFSQKNANMCAIRQKH